MQEEEEEEERQLKGKVMSDRAKRVLFIDIFIVSIQLRIRIHPKMYTSKSVINLHNNINGESSNLVIFTIRMDE